MGVDIAIYWVRIGTGVGRQIWKRILGSDEVERVSWFWGVLMDLLALGGGKVHPSPPLEHDKVHQTLKLVKNPGEGE